MDARLVASRLPGIAMYGQPFNTPPFPGYLPYGPTDATAFYSPLQAGENADAWRAGLTQAAAAYYDPAITAHYGYGYGPMGLSDGARRKNATRETTSTLKAWLNEHRKNPYPTKGEKIMLAIITKMTLTQVSTWFANARRRLKKENKMTWSPRNRCGEDDDDDIMDGDDDNNLNNNSNNRDGFTSSANHLTVGESNNSRCSSPSSSTLGNGPVVDGPSRVSGFDLPQQGAHHPFVPRADITGSFTIRGPTNGQTNAHGKESESKSRRQSSNAEGEEEIDLESVDEVKKDAAFVKRSMSNDSHSQEVATSYPALLKRPIVSSPLVSQTAPTHTGLFPSVPTPSAFHPSIGNSSNASAASLLAATRGHSLPPHVLAGINADPRNPSQRIPHMPNPPLGQHLSSFGPVPSKLSPQSSRHNSTSPSTHPYSRNAASSPTSSVASSSSVNCSPLKPKIWSLADVATSQDGSKNAIHEDTKSSSSSSIPNSSLLSSSPTLVHDRGLHVSHSGSVPPHQAGEGFSQATLRNWMDGMMQHKMAAAAAAAAAMSGGQPHPPFFPGAMLPQHLAAALNPAALAVAASLPRGGDGGRFPHPFSGFAELAAAQQRAHMAAHIAGVHHLQSSPVSAPPQAHATSVSKIMATPIPSRQRINSFTSTKSHSQLASSPPHAVSQHLEISGFTPLNTRPDSSDSGIVSAETSKDSLTQGNESTNSK